MKIVYTNGWGNTLTDDEVLDALGYTGEKLLISNGKTMSQVSWAPDNMIEIVTIDLNNMEIQNHFFDKFEGIETIKKIKINSYKDSQFVYGYLQD